MKKVVYLSIILSLLASSCSNTNPVTPSGSPCICGYWTFQGNTYNTVAFTIANNSITATSSTTPTESISVFFSGLTLPTITDTPTTYTVVNTLPVGNQVYIRVTTNGVNTFYTSLGENDSIMVSRRLTSMVSTTGKIISIEGSGIKMINNSNAYDSAILVLFITQSQ